MDWFSWLSRTSLEPSLIYEYGLAFGRNELQLEDAAYFNHEFLQSMGISIAKHRLEILKLAKKEEGAMPRTKKLSGAIKKCLRKCISKLVLREEEDEVKEYMTPEPNWYQAKWRRSLLRNHGTDQDLKGEKGMHRSRTIALSGPLDGRIMHEKMMGSKVLKLSGPLDGTMNERMLMYTNRSPIITRPVAVDSRFMGTAKSPRLSGPLDARAAMVNGRSPRLTRPSDERGESPMGYSPYNKTKGDSDYDDEYALWPALFEDLKPN